MKSVRGVRHPLWLCLALVAALCAGCKAKPATVEIAPVAQPILAFEPFALPSVVVKDERGQPLEEQPEVVFSVDSSTVAVVSNGQLHPRGNGTAMLVAQVKDTEVSSSVPLTLRLLDKVELECPGNAECAFEVGNTVDLRARILSEGAAMENVPATWTSSDPAVVKVEGPGKVQALALGEAEVKVSSLNNSQATKKIRVVKPTHVAVKCGDGAECSLEAGQRLVLKAQVFADAVALPNRTLNWAASSPDIVTVDQQGTLEALQEGVGTITVTGAGVQGTVDVTVRLPPARVIVGRAGQEESSSSESSEESGAETETVTLFDGRVIPKTKLAGKKLNPLEAMGLSGELPKENKGGMTRCTPEMRRKCTPTLSNRGPTDPRERLRWQAECRICM